MSTVEEIEKAIASLPPAELAALRAWFFVFFAEEQHLPSRVSRTTLDELLAGVTAENVHSEWADGPPTGTESL